MDWTNDISAAVPDSSVLDEKFPVVISVRDFLITKYGYDYINIILTSGKVIEITIDSYDVGYVVYDSLRHLVNAAGLSLSQTEGDITPETYIAEFDLKPVPKDVEDILKKIIPLDVVGMYHGSL